MEIKPIKKIWTTDGVHVVQIKIYDPHEVRQLEANYKEAIEALVELHKRFDVSKSWGNFDAKYYAFMQITRPIIEKAYGESWEDIRREK